MTESLLLALMGAVAGLILSAITIRVAVRVLDWPSFVAVAPDWRVIGFAFGTAIAASLFFGLAPALQATRTDARHAARLRLALIGTQTATSCALLILSGLLTRGIQKAVDTSPGFSFEESAVIDPGLAGVGREGKSAQLYFEELRTRIAQVAGVEATALATTPPLGDRTSTRRTAHGNMHVNHIDSGYFETMRIPLRSGRAFQKGDTNVIIVGERAAAKLFPNVDPIGKEFVSGDGKQRWSVIGVVANASITSPGDPDAMELYFPIQESDLSTVLLVRTTRLNDVIKTLQQTANAIDSRVIPQITPMRDGMASRIRNTRDGAMAVTLLGVVSLALALIGFVGLISFAVTQRTREIGIRLALGATRWEVMRLGLESMMLPTAGGLVAGLAGAAGLAYALRSQLFGLSSLDPVTFGLVPVLFLALALLCSMGPLGRAARVDPATALRHE
jgi:predicted permease